MSTKVKYDLEITKESEESFIEELKRFIQDFFEGEVTVKKVEGQDT